LHVRDVVDAYVRLLARGQPGEVYNVASGQGLSLEELLFKLAGLVGVRVIPEADPDLMRPADIPHLVWDAGKLRALAGRAPRCCPRWVARRRSTWRWRWRAMARWSGVVWS